ncbi:MAG TPA: ABC transporter ATP-binding protein [Actinomycetota bacterium]|jgi:ATP-binding cassette subfamily B protein
MKRMKKSMVRLAAAALASSAVLVPLAWTTTSARAAAAIDCPVGQELDPVTQLCKEINEMVSPTSPPPPNHSGKKGGSGGGANKTGSGSGGGTPASSSYGSPSYASTGSTYGSATTGQRSGPRARGSGNGPGAANSAPFLKLLGDSYAGGGPIDGVFTPAVIEVASRTPFGGAVGALARPPVLFVLILLLLAAIGVVRLSRRSKRLVEVREAFHIFRPTLAGQKWGLVEALGLTLLVIGLELLRPWPIKFVVDKVLKPHAGGTSGLDVSSTVIFAAAATVVISVLLGVTSVRAVVAAAQVGRKITVRIRRQVFEHLHRLAIPFHEEARTGDLLYRLMSDVNDVRDALFESWLNVITKTLLVFGTAVAMLFVDVRVAIIALLPLPLLGIQLVRLSRRLRGELGDQFRHEAKAASLASETLRQISLVKAFVAEKRLTKTYAKVSRRGERKGVAAALTSGRMNFTIELLTGIGLAAVLFFGALDVLSGRLSVGTLVVLATYARSLYKPLRKAPNEGEDLSKAMASTKRLVEVLRVPTEEYGAGRSAPRFRGEITLRDVRFAYRDGIEALRGVTLEVPPGALVVVQGPNGSGKSTLLAILLRLLQPDAGRLLIDDEPATSFELQSYRRRFAYVPQHVQLFGATVRENIAYGRPDASDEEIEEAAGVTLFDEVARRLPDGYEQVLGEGGATLSGGEARRLMLARGALRDARVVLLDEPLAGLDPAARETVARAIRGLAAERTTFVVSHGDAWEVEPDMVVRMADGTVQSVEWSSSGRAVAGSGGGMGVALSP